MVKHINSYKTRSICHLLMKGSPSQKKEISIESVNTHKHLGITIDKILTWEQ